MTGCSTPPSDDDGSAETGTAGDTGGPDEGGIEEDKPDTRVECCWTVRYGQQLPCGGASSCPTFEEVLCLPIEHEPTCMDVDDLDQDGSGSVDDTEYYAACFDLCSALDYEDSNLPVLGSGLEPKDEDWDESPSGWYIHNCFAYTAEVNFVDENSCLASEFSSVPYREPTHFATVGDPDDAEVQVDVLGFSLEPELAGRSDMVLRECSRNTLRRSKCILDIRGLALSLDTPMTAGDAIIAGGGLEQIGSVSTTVQFDNCPGGVCSASFELSEASGTPIEMGLTWDEKFEGSGSANTMFLPLSNGDGGLGELSAIDGTLSLHLQTEQGHLRLVGEATDSADGTLADVSYDVEMQVTPAS